jgi:predicted short-subunit dehydrogenase-like oxidoreductase (DUF2520 family)
MTIRGCSIVGTGVAARAIAPALQAANIEVREVAGRDRVKTARLAAEIGVATSAIGDVATDVDLILLCVSDHAIAEVAAELAKGHEFAETIVAHMAGASPARILDPLRARGARPGKAHPIASLAGGPARLRGVMWGVEGDTAVLRDLRGLVQILGGHSIDLAQIDLELYHLAAVFASNFIIGVFAEAAELWRRSGAAASPGSALIPLARTVLANWEDVGLDSALTGPIVRGDAGAIAAQLRRVAGEGQSLESLYRALALETAGVAARRLDANQRAIAEIVRILGENEVLN